MKMFGVDQPFIVPVNYPSGLVKKEDIPDPTLKDHDSVTLGCSYDI